MSTNKLLLKVAEVYKNFTVGGQEIKVLKNNNMSVNSGDFVVIFGPSGCGKSTLLNTILGMEKPTSGKLLFDGVDIYEMSEDEISRFRKKRVGVVFQQPIWVKSLNVLNNVCFPGRLLTRSEKEAKEQAIKSLQLMGMERFVANHPSELSSGQQQRVSLARALTIDPLIIVADEPTGNLDTVSGKQLMDLLLKLNEEEGKTIIMVTHDMGYLKYATRLIHMVDGVIVDELYGKEKVAEFIKEMGPDVGRKIGDKLTNKI